ncbi:serine/threonine-protein kinase [Leptolyngbya ohadii]|uniref:serine/threonine-protein kinase n=1 Tax=Leptolyngbya ohadii TaxID=1962290 RepID=UPI000B5A1862|nr:serine/threonine-protein kinase [Leptolyngbya ohadii]
MICCLNPHCKKPINADSETVCQSCGSSLIRLRDRYRAVEPLGQGGFGKTYLAVDEDRLNSKCVIKQFSPQVQGTKSLEKAVQLFYQEAVRLDELGEHSQIPRLLAYFEQERYLYLVQQFVEGQSLLQEMKQNGTFSERQIRDVLSDVLPVLRFIHRQQVIHRDITPANILRRQSDDRLVLIDFGVAKQVNEESAAEPGTRIGTEGYAPMEQFRGGKAYPASDLYSLGATCLHLLTGTRPDNLYDPLNGCWIWREYLRDEKKKLVSDQLAHILNYLLKDLVSERYQSADEVMRDLNADSFLPSVPRAIQSPGAGQSSPPRRASIPPAVAPPSKPPASQPPKTPVSRPPASRPPVSQPPRPSAPPVPSSPGIVSGRAANRSSRALHILTGHASWVTCVAISPNAQTIASSSLDDTVRLWNATTGEAVSILKGHSRGVNTIAISPDGKTLISGSDDYTLKIWNVNSGALLGTLTGHSRDVNAVAVSPDSKLFVSGGEDRTIRIWSLTTGAMMRSLSDAASMIRTLAISPDGKLLAGGGLDNKVRLWNLATGSPLQVLSGHLNSINAIAFCGDGKTLVTGSKDKSIRIWNYQTGELLRTLSEHTRDVNAIALTPNDRLLISGSSDTTIRIWDLASGRVLLTWADHADAVNSLAVSVDGKLLVSGSSDKTVRIWQLPT